MTNYQPYGDELVRTAFHESVELRKEKDALAEALIAMYEQYCPNGHEFMTAGERASTVLEIQCYADFDEAGRITWVREGYSNE